MWDFGPAHASVHILNRIEAASDKHYLCLSKGDFNGATLSVTPASDTFHLVIRMACSVVVDSPHRQRELASSEGWVRAFSHQVVRGNRFYWAGNDEKCHTFIWFGLLSHWTLLKWITPPGQPHTVTTARLGWYCPKQPPNKKTKSMRKKNINWPGPRIEIHPL